MNGYGASLQAQEDYKGRAHLARLAKYREVAEKLREIRPGHQIADYVQAVCIAEEAGEFLKEFRRWQGHARVPGYNHDVAMELADVIIASYCGAELFGIDLDAAIDAKLQAIKDRGGI